MFSKLEVLGALTVSLVGGLVCGYCGAGAFCLLAIVFSAGAQKEPEATEKEETP